MQLADIKLRNYGSIQEYVNDGLNIDDGFNTSLMLAGVTDDFKPLIMAGENSKKKLSVDGVKNLLLQHAKFNNYGMEKVRVLYSKNSNSKKKKQVQCYNCKEYGHISRNSLHKRNGHNNNTNNHVNNRNNTKQKKKNEKRQISSTSINVLVSTNERYNTNEDFLYWYVDSAASKHMMNISKNMHNVHCVERKKVADKNELNVECAGDIDLNILYGNKEKK